MNTTRKNTKKGYEYLLVYKLGVPIYDYTIEFCRCLFNPHHPYHPYHPYSRTRDQIEQSARSGMVNIPEGYSGESLETYIKLAGVSRGSYEELLKDFQSFARHQHLAIWPKEKAVREIREIGEIWKIIKNSPTLPDNPHFPNLPTNLEATVNLLITLINQENYLLDKLIAALKEKFIHEGGFRENLFKKRLEYRKKLL